MPKISNEFKERLEQLTDRDIIGVIVTIDFEANPSEKIFSNQERTEKIEEIIERTKPLVSYLIKKGVTCKQDFSALGEVYSEMTKEQIYELAKQDFVSSIFENYIIYYVED